MVKERTGHEKEKNVQERAALTTEDIREKADSDMNWTKGRRRKRAEVVNGKVAGEQRNERREWDDDETQRRSVVCVSFVREKVESVKLLALPPPVLSLNSFHFVFPPYGTDTSFPYQQWRSCQEHKSSTTYAKNTPVMTTYAKNTRVIQHIHVPGRLCSVP